MSRQHSAHVMLGGVAKTPAPPSSTKNPSSAMTFSFSNGHHEYSSPFEATLLSYNLAVAAKNVCSSLASKGKPPIRGLAAVPGVIDRIDKEATHVKILTVCIGAIRKAVKQE